jgi:hypothetical protein
MTVAAVAIGGAALVGAGTSIYASNKAAKTQKKALESADQQTALAQEQFDFQRQIAQHELDYTDQTRRETDPARKFTLLHLQNFLDGGFLPRGIVPDQVPFDPNYAPVRDTIESQYQVARNNVIERAPVRGGTLGTALEQVEAARAHDLGSEALTEAQARAQADERYQYGVVAPVRASLFGRASEIATGQPTQQLAGLQGAAAISSTNAPTFGQAGQLTATLAGQSATQATAAGASTGSAAALAAYLKKQQGKGPGTPGLPAGTGAQPAYDYGLE